MLFLIVIAIGVAAGLYYGWVLSPVKYIDTAPDSLRMDYKSDYVLMVAEAYRLENNLSLAARRLAILGTDSPDIIITQAIQFAEEIGYNDQDLLLMQTLAEEIKTWNPSQEVPPP